MIQVNRIYLIFNRLVTKKFLVDTSDVYILLLQIFVCKVRQNQQKLVLSAAYQVLSSVIGSVI